MSFYDAIKDAASIAQKADNVELYKQLLDLGAQALDMQAEIARLQAENTELKKRNNLAGKIVRHAEPCVTLADDDKELYYCSHCWDSEQLLIQLSCHPNGTFDCPHCHTKGNYDNEKKKRSDLSQLEAMSKMNRVIKNPYF